MTTNKIAKIAGNSPGGSSGGAGDYLVRLPQTIVYVILEKLDLGTLCTAACVCRALRSGVSQVLSSSPALDLSAFSADDETLNHIRHRFGKLRSITFDCLRLDNFHSIGSLLGEHTHELNLWKGTSLSSDVLAYIGDRCPNLRILLVELASGVSADRYKRNLTYMLKRCSVLESLCIKNRGPEYEPSGCHFKDLSSSLPDTVKNLKLQSLNLQDAIDFTREFGQGRNSSEISPLVYPASPGHALQSLSLVLDFISDELIITIASFLPVLVELDLEDRPSVEPTSPNDLTNNGLQSLGFCQHLASLSLVRSKLYVQVSFKRVTDMGMFLLSECCKGLQYFKLGGFSKVSDAGFTAILHSCQNLKRFEICNASKLSDLAFHDINGAPCSLSDVKLSSCNITSESVKELACSRDLEVLDLSGCRSIADSCLGSVSFLSNLNTLNLAGADITDEGLASMGKGDSPITRLNLRGCKRVTDKGIWLLLNGVGKINKTLSSLDLGSLPGISDKAIFTIDAAAPSLTELCIRYCYFVTDASVEALASSERRSEQGKSSLRKLDLFHCSGLSHATLGLLKKPFFRGLQWVGVGSTSLTVKGDQIFRQIREERPWLTLCLEGCEMGCHDGWQFHKFGCN